MLKDMKILEKDLKVVGREKLQKHLWYVSEKLVPLAFFDEDVSIETKKAMIKNLDRESNQLDINCWEIPKPQVPPPRKDGSLQLLQLQLILP